MSIRRNSTRKFFAKLSAPEPGLSKPKTHLDVGDSLGLIAKVYEPEDIANQVEYLPLK
jgi:hypothetical protein